MQILNWQPHIFAYRSDCLNPEYFHIKLCRFPNYSEIIGRPNKKL